MPSRPVRHVGLLLACLTCLVGAGVSEPSRGATAPGTPPAASNQDTDSIMSFDRLVEGVGFDVLVVASKWGLVPSFCVAFTSRLDEKFGDMDQLEDAFEAAKNRLATDYAWYDPWANLQSLVLSVLYYFGSSTTWLFSKFGLSLVQVEFYLLPLPQIYTTLVPRPYADAGPDEPLVLYRHLEDLGYEVVKVAEVLSVTGPSVTVLFRTTDKPREMREWVWAKIDAYMERYGDQWSLSYLTLSSLLYLLREADGAARDLAERPEIDLDYLAIELGLFPSILNRQSLSRQPPAEFYRDPCQ